MLFGSVTRRALENYIYFKISKLIWSSPQHVSFILSYAFYRRYSWYVLSQYIISLLQSDESDRVVYSQLSQEEE